MTKVWVALMVIAMVLILGACGGGGESASPEPEINAKALVEDRCTQCHGLSTITDAKKTPEQWEMTVSNMVQKGARLNDAEQAAVVAYLAETYGP